MTDKLTLAEMLTDMGVGISPTELELLKTVEAGAPLDPNTLKPIPKPDPVLPNSNKVKGKTFHNRQFTLISCAYFRVYLQSVLPIDTLDPEDIGAFLNLAVASPIGYKGPKNEALEYFIRNTIESGEYKGFYTNKEWHMQWLKEAQELGLVIDVNKLANRKRVLATINEYLEALSDFLSTQGYPSTEAYLLKNPRKVRGVKAKPVDLSNLWDQL